MEAAETKKIKKPELLAPVGNWTMLNAAIAAGADAIYFGLKNLNMRAAANNFDIAELPKIVDYCKQHNVKAHLTLNTIVFEEELSQLDSIVAVAKSSGVEMIICWDLSIINKCIEYEMPFCVSTQASASNSATVNFYERLGAKRIVLARECTLDKIKEIKSKTNLEIETFIHGAMCVAVSGRCFMSHEVFGRSANRGECLQPCRREYQIVDTDEKFSLELGTDYVLSPKDLCSIEFIDQLIESGIDAFKIEGRKRSPEYIAKVVSTYRKAIDSYFEKNLTTELKSELVEELKKVYNRGFSQGFYFGQPSSESFADTYGSTATTRKVFVGKVLNFYKKNGIAHVKLEAEALSIGDSIYIIGSTTGVVEMQLTRFMHDGVELQTAEKGNTITFECNAKVRENDKVYKIVFLEN
ncbi:MAG: U32 family peptidase [Bacteroidetes bacterium]|nr:U32 family peptidase [Bacteroidota bacterium]